MWINRTLGLYLKTWRLCREAPAHPIVGGHGWSNRTLKGTSFYQYPSWTFNFWLGRRMFCISRNCA